MHMYVHIFQTILEGMNFCVKVVKLKLKAQIKHCAEFCVGLGTRLTRFKAILFLCPDFCPFIKKYTVMSHIFNDHTYTYLLYKKIKTHS